MLSAVLFIAIILGNNRISKSDLLSNTISPTGDPSLNSQLHLQLLLDKLLLLFPKSLLKVPDLTKGLSHYLVSLTLT